MCVSHSHRRSESIRPHFDIPDWTLHARFCTKLSHDPSRRTSCELRWLSLLLPGSGVGQEKARPAQVTRLCNSRGINCAGFCSRRSSRVKWQQAVPKCSTHCAGVCGEKSLESTRASFEDARSRVNGAGATVAASSDSPAATLVVSHLPESAAVSCGMQATTAHRPRRRHRSLSHCSRHHRPSPPTRQPLSVVRLGHTRLRTVS